VLVLVELKHLPVLPALVELKQVLVLPAASRFKSASTLLMYDAA